MTKAELTDPALRISPRTFRQLADFITAEVGIKMPDSKVSMIQSRLLRLVRDLGLGSIDEYCVVLFASPPGSEERVQFVNAITTNKTDFFREPQHFKQLTATVLPQLERARPALVSEGVAVWSAPCSTGEEPYTLAMVLSEYYAERPRVQFRILGTDVSTRVLETARTAIYSRTQIDPVPLALRRKYLLQGQGTQSSLVRLVPALRRQVRFAELNLMESSYDVDTFDIIFCRNVLIYFDRPTQEAVINKLCRRLHPGGYFFVSHSESLSELKVPLVSLGGSCFRKQGLC